MAFWSGATVTVVGMTRSSINSQLSRKRRGLLIGAVGVKSRWTRRTRECVTLASSGDGRWATSKRAMWAVDQEG